MQVPCGFIGEHIHLLISKFGFELELVSLFLVHVLVQFEFNLFIVLIVRV